MLKKLFEISDDKKIKKYLLPILPSNPVIVEAGAHIGKDTVEMSRLWKKGIIHAFEPIPDIYHQLVKNTSRYKNIITYPIALSSDSGTAEIFVSSGKSNASSSLLSPKEHINQHPEVHFNNSIIIKTITLNDWATRNNISSIDFLWLDMQGNELAVIKSISDALLSKVVAIYTEVSLIETYKGVPLYPEIKEWMLSRGFKAQVENLKWKDMGNVLFVRKSDQA